MTRDRTKHRRSKLGKHFLKIFSTKFDQYFLINLKDLKEALKKGKDASARTSESHSETDKPVEPVPEAVKSVELQPDAQTAGELRIEIQVKRSKTCNRVD